MIRLTLNRMWAQEKQLEDRNWLIKPTWTMDIKLATLNLCLGLKIKTSGNTKTIPKINCAQNKMPTR